MINAQLLGELAVGARFILYRKSDKVPVDTTGVPTDHLNPVNQMTLEIANAWVQANPDLGVGLVLREDEPYFCIDVDHAYDMSTGNWNDISRQLVQQFPGALGEVSLSGTGLHLFGKCNGIPEHSNKNKELGIELYTKERYIALTGRNMSGEIRDWTPELTQIIPYYFPPGSKATGPQGEWRNVPLPGYAPPEDDLVLIDKMMNSKSGSSMFSNKPSIVDLWTNNISKLAAFWPANKPDAPYDQSSADAALAQQLVFWTAGNHQRIYNLMWQSGLRRKKWEDRPDYMQRTIMNAVANHKGSYYGEVKEQQQQQQTFDPNSQFTSGFQVLAPDQQMQYFQGCTYITTENKVFVPTGQLLKPEQFRNTYGGYKFIIDQVEYKDTDDAFKALTHNRAVTFPKAHDMCFRATLPPGAIIQENNLLLVNTYIPIITPRKKGDWTPFMRHLEKLFPDERDRYIILSWIAALIQYPGVKFQWCPVIQGCEGNGKTMIGYCLQEAIGRQYVHFPNAQDIQNKFTGWLPRKLLIILEEFYVGADRREILERLKPLITNLWVEIQGKGADQISGENMANWLPFTNHKDALLTSINDRRYSSFYTPQQSVFDLIKWGMDGDYFPRMWNWLRNQDGYAIVHDFLATFEIIPEFNPAEGCHRAPTTTSTEEARDISLGGVEQEILEAIEQERPGFRGGWISSTALDELLKQIGADRKIPRNKRRDLLRTLGYDWHPALPDGRSTSVIIQEQNTRPRIFVRQDSSNMNITNPHDVVLFYKQAQGHAI